MTKKIKLKPTKITEGINLIPFGISQMRKYASEFIKDSIWSLTSKNKTLDIELISFNNNEANIKIKGKKSTVSEFLLILTTKPAFTQVFCWEEL